MFKITHESKKSKARCGLLKTAHGTLETPFFMPVATQGTIKHISTEEMEKLGSKIILSNTYHLMLRPGEDYLKKIGGLHKFISWPKAILTDSGGFQIFSLAGNKNKTGKSLVKLSEKGVKLKSYIDGREFDLTPELAFRIQKNFGVDIAVCLDECVALPAKKEYIAESVELTTHWARRTKAYFEKELKKRKDLPMLFAVIQGGLLKEFRLKSLRELKEIGFDGYNIGGLSVGETEKEMYQVLDYLVPEMPENKPRYLMGVGYPKNIIEAVKRGVDMFDCVIPTREGRHGRLFVWGKSRNRKLQITNYKSINITNTKFKNDKTPINSESKLAELRNYSKAYLHYLFSIKEPLALRLASLNNLEFYLDLMEKIRIQINNGKL